MNDRYPMLDSSRNSSSPSVQSSRRDNGQTTKTRESTRELVAQSRIGDLVMAMRSQSAMGLADLEKPSTKRVDGASTTATRPLAKQTQSTTELRARFTSSLSDDARPIGIKRKSVIKPISMIADETLQHITAGPYASEAVRTTMHARHENTPPPSLERDRLPALSSSEWLAGPSAKQQRASGHALGDAGRVNATVPGKRGSPGQRLATGWLEGRAQQDRDDTPAFV